ncbi:MAG: ribonuclease HII [Candidatus Dojkabacteria bacterium]
MIFPDTKIEQKLWKEGYKVVVGLDEAGRGPLAGPVVASAVVISNLNQVVPTVRDSKKMTEKQRNQAYEKIKEISHSYGVGIVGSREIDAIGIQKAVQKAMKIAVEVVEAKLNTKADYIIADGLNILKIPNYKMKKFKQGDLYHYSISAASVLAKVTRDSIMKKYHKKYTVYGFDKHMGYGTKMHMDAIKKYGICDIHRRSFKPIKDAIQLSKL